MSANQRPRFHLRFCQSQTRIKIRQKCQPISGRIRMMSYHMTKRYETLPFTQGFHDTLLAPVTFHSNCTAYSFFLSFYSIRFFGLIPVERTQNGRIILFYSILGELKLRSCGRGVLMSRAWAPLRFYDSPEFFPLFELTPHIFLFLSRKQQLIVKNYLRPFVSCYL